MSATVTQGDDVSGVAVISGTLAPDFDDPDATGYTESDSVSASITFKCGTPTVAVNSTGEWAFTVTATPNQIVTDNSDYITTLEITGYNEYWTAPSAAGDPVVLTKSNWSSDDYEFNYSAVSTRTNYVQSAAATGSFTVETT
jgi:hypothetical protein